MAPACLDSDLQHLLFSYRRMEDFVTWVDTSKLKRTIMSYNDELDDYDLL